MEARQQAKFIERKSVLLKGAMELSLVCNCDVAIIMFTPEGKLCQYSSSSMDEVLDRYSDAVSQPHERLTNKDLFKQHFGLNLSGLSKEAEEKAVSAFVAAMGLPAMTAGGPDTVAAVAAEDENGNIAAEESNLCSLCDPEEVVLQPAQQPPAKELLSGRALPVPPVPLACAQVTTTSSSPAVATDQHSDPGGQHDAAAAAEVQAAPSSTAGPAASENNSSKSAGGDLGAGTATAAAPVAPAGNQPKTNSTGVGGKRRTHALDQNGWLLGAATPQLPGLGMMPMMGPMFNPLAAAGMFPGNNGNPLGAMMPPSSNPALAAAAAVNAAAGWGPMMGAAGGPWNPCLPGLGGMAGLPIMYPHNSKKRKHKGNKGQKSQAT